LNKNKLKIQSNELKPKQQNRKKPIYFGFMIIGISGCVAGGTANLYPEYNNVIIMPTGFVRYGFWLFEFKNGGIKINL